MPVCRLHRTRKVLGKDHCILVFLTRGPIETRPMVTELCSIFQGNAIVLFIFATRCLKARVRHFFRSTDCLARSNANNIVSSSYFKSINAAKLAYKPCFPINIVRFLFAVCRPLLSVGFSESKVESVTLLLSVLMADMDDFQVRTTCLTAGRFSQNFSIRHIV